MARLIDADKLKRVYAQSPSAPLPSFVAGSEIDNAPTVKAIPVDWINKWVITKFVGAGRVIDSMIEEWEKENDKGSE